MLITHNRNKNKIKKPYYGPADGKSRPRKHRKALKAISNALLSTGYKIETQGQENLPKDGAHVYTFNHPTVLDPVLALNLVEQDMRTVANIEVFRHPVSAKIMEWAGAYPVDRRNPSMVTKRHPVELLQQGVSLGVFPEGGNAPEEQHGQIGAFKKGPAYCAIHGGAETVVPTVFDFQPAQPKSRARALLAGSAAFALTAGASLLGGGAATGARIAVGTLSGALVGGAAGRKFAKPGKWYDPTPDLLGRLGGGAAGAAAGGVLAALAGPLEQVLPSTLSATITGLAGAAAVYGLTRSREKRTVARVLVGQPIEVKPFRNQEDPVKDLTVALHQKMGAMKSKLSGVPYDENAPKIHAKGRYANH